MIPQIPMVPQLNGLMTEWLEVVVDGGPELHHTRARTWLERRNGEAVRALELELPVYDTAPPQPELDWDALFATGEKLSVTIYAGAARGSCLRARSSMCVESSAVVNTCGEGMPEVATLRVEDDGASAKLYFHAPSPQTRRRVVLRGSFERLARPR